MNCEQCRNVLSEWVDGELSECLKLELETHVKTCETCRLEARKQEFLIGELRFFFQRLDPLRTAPPAAHRVVPRGARRQPSTVASTVTGWWSGSWAWQAGLVGLVCFALGYMLVSYHGSPGIKLIEGNLTTILSKEVFAPGAYLSHNQVFLVTSRARVAHPCQAQGSFQKGSLFAVDHLGFHLQEGLAMFSKTSNGRRFRVKVPTASLAVRGTRFDVSVHAEGMVAYLHEGILVVEHGGRTYDIPAGTVFSCSPTEFRQRVITGEKWLTMLRNPTWEHARRFMTPTPGPSSGPPFLLPSLPTFPSDAISASQTLSSFSNDPPFPEITDASVSLNLDRGDSTATFSEPGIGDSSTSQPGGSDEPSAYSDNTTPDSPSNPDEAIDAE